MVIYSGIINVLSVLVDSLATFAPKENPRKFFRFAKGQRHIISHIKNTYSNPDNKPTAWIHAASLGEFGIARPILRELKKQGYLTVMTFFSPTGYEALEKMHPEIDFLYYLPFDTRNNASQFIDTIQPQKAIFMVSEYWFNYLDLLHKKNIDTYLVSAKISEKSIFFKPYGKLYRHCLPTYKRFFVLDDDSKTHLNNLGVESVTITGNPLFDNAVQKAQKSWQDATIEHFTKGQKVFIAGSIHDENDLRLVTDLANKHQDVKFLMVPHETSDKSTQALKHALKAPALAYSECDADTNLDDVQSLIIDFVGALAYIYRYAQWAYVGGGFTPYLHSLIEATVYGLPVAFGPMTYRKVTPQQIVELGIGQIVHDSDELDQWFSTLKDNAPQLETISDKAKEYVISNTGSTKEIVDAIIG